MLLPISRLCADLLAEDLNPQVCVAWDCVGHLLITMKINIPRSLNRALGGFFHLILKAEGEIFLITSQALSKHHISTVLSKKRLSYIWKSMQLKEMVLVDYLDRKSVV